MSAFLQLLGSFVGVVAIALVFQVPRDKLLLAGFSGFLSWGAYLLAMCFGANSTLAIFIASIALTLISHILARIVRVPVTLFLIPGIMPLVPGAGMYRTAYSLIFDFENFTHQLSNTLMTAGAIALGIFIVDAFFRAVYSRK